MIFGNNSNKNKLIITEKIMHFSLFNEILQRLSFNEIENFGLSEKYCIFQGLGATPKYEPISTKFYREYLFMK